jgi:serine protease inhibitor
LTTDEPLQIGFVIQQANITVNEAGTEPPRRPPSASRPSAPESEPIVVTVERPFLRALRDRETGRGAVSSTA